MYIYVDRYWNSLKELILQIINCSTTGWIILFLFIVIFGIKKLTKKKQSFVTVLSSISPPQYKKTDLGKHNLFGVMWNVWMGYDSLSTNNDKERLWADDPFCPRCDYELDRDEEKDKWICVKCNQSFKIPKNIKNDTKEKVIKIFEAELRRQQNKK